MDLNDDMEEYDELTEIMSNAHLNTNFLALAREVSNFKHFLCLFQEKLVVTHIPNAVG